MRRKDMIVETSALVKRYRDVIAVDNLDLAIEEGEIVGLLGPNGAGKSTTINGIIGLTDFDSGEVALFGRKMRRVDRDTRRKMGLVPQDIAVFEDLTAEENVSYFGRLYGLKGRALAGGVDNALDFTGLSDRRGQKPKSFSGGMKRRLNIACALVHSPQLIIMDEPTVGIDPQSRNHILESVRELNRKGVTIIYTSHYMEEVEAVCSRVIIMDHGRVIARGTQSDLKTLVADKEIIDIELERMTPDLVDLVSGVSGVKGCTSEGNHLRITVQRDGVRLGRVIEKASESGAEILSVQVERPSLESVFLSLTGRSLRD
jgi:ABC-2 type transport system ATP-binding protein